VILTLITVGLCVVNGSMSASNIESDDSSGKSEIDGGSLSSKDNRLRSLGLPFDDSWMISFAMLL
jgi:hypothetical protein